MRQGRHRDRKRAEEAKTYQGVQVSALHWSLGGSQIDATPSGTPKALDVSKYTKTYYAKPSIQPTIQSVEFPIKSQETPHRISASANLILTLQKNTTLLHTRYLFFQVKINSKLIPLLHLSTQLLHPQLIANVCNQINPYNTKNQFTTLKKERNH